MKTKDYSEVFELSDFTFESKDITYTYTSKDLFFQGIYDIVENLPLGQTKNARIKIFHHGNIQCTGRFCFSKTYYDKKSLSLSLHPRNLLLTNFTNSLNVEEENMEMALKVLSYWLDKYQTTIQEIAAIQLPPPRKKFSAGSI